MYNIFNIKIEAKIINPFGLTDFEIRRVFYIFKWRVFTTDWFKVSDLWPSAKLFKADIIKYKITIIN